MRVVVVSAALATTMMVGVAMAGSVDTTWIASGKIIGATSLTDTLQALQAQINAEPALRDAAIAAEAFKAASAPNIRVAKAWLYYRPDTGYVNGFNVQSVEVVNASGIFRVHFAAPMQSYRYAAVASALGAYARLEANGPDAITVITTNLAGALVAVEFSLVVFAD